MELKIIELITIVGLIYIGAVFIGQLFFSNGELTLMAGGLLIVCLLSLFWWNRMSKIKTPNNDDNERKIIDEKIYSNNFSRCFTF
ncbi:hypothetical protein ACEN4P_12070 [Marinilactibacillus psychrotolerans]|uniref:hypothetical protein n=1 Tax=Marinilactibacillus psychrotolerans TaxID=191770 RepID=UPI000B350223|nr:hypothetical protein [Marinilactibacillus psychrotolerans]